MESVTGLVILAAVLVTSTMVTVCASLIDVPERPRRRPAHAAGSQR